MNNLTKKDVLKIIQKNVPFKQLEKDARIFEFFKYKNNSMGISFIENENKEDVYIYNIFTNNDDYINICGEGTFSNPYTDEIIEQLVKKWNEIILTS